MNILNEDLKRSIQRLDDRLDTINKDMNAGFTAVMAGLNLNNKG